MRYFFILTIVIVFSNKLHAKNDTVILNSPKIFKITYLDSANKSSVTFSNYSTYNEVYLDTLTRQYLVIEFKHTDLTNPLTNRKIARVPLKDIKEFGYIKGNRSDFGTLLGLGVGAAAGLILGAFAEKQDELYDEKPAKSILVGGVIGMVTGGAMGYFLGGMFNDYTMYNLEKYNSNLNKKFEEILKISTLGLKNYKYP